MLQSVTWQQYFLFIIIATCLYYLYVWIVYFNGAIFSLLRFNSVQPLSIHGEDQPDEVLTTTQYIIQEIKPLFAGRKNRSELLLALQGKLRPYHQWDEEGFRETINQYIAIESETICSIRLSEADLRALWK